MAFIVTVFRMDDQAMLDAYNGEPEEILNSMSEESYSSDFLDAIDQATHDLWAELPGTQRSVWHHPHSAEVRKV